MDATQEHLQNNITIVPLRIKIEAWFY